MRTVHEIEAAIARLSRQDPVGPQFWFSRFDAANWDTRFEEDVTAGRLDAVADEALAERRDHHTECDRDTRGSSGMATPGGRGTLRSSTVTRTRS